jgi:hypothetical protein
MPETLSLVKRLREFFQISASDLMKEYRALTDADKEWYVNEFNKIGLPTVLSDPKQV